MYSPHSCVKVTASQGMGKASAFLTVVQSAGRFKLRTPAGNGKAFIDCDDKNVVGTFSNVVNWLVGLGYDRDTLPIVQTASGVGRHVYVNFTNSLLGSRRNFINSFGAGDFRYGSASKSQPFQTLSRAWVNTNYCKGILHACQSWT